jgi:hypothetical protein
MRDQRMLWGAVVLLASALLAPGQRPLLGQADDLDSFDDARLDRDLEAELDDIYEDFAPEARVALGELEEAILEALSDEGDDGIEDDISLEDLEAEMREAGTTLEDCVERGLQQADLQAAGRRPSGWSVVRVSLRAQQGDGMTTPRLAVRQVKGAIRFDVRRAQGRRE